ncbi:hypothetical protein H8356DRAFT_1340642 [Neocallimastix lanati (nom. inval.)]|nr:hypothetical protein H8356DRAFT_1340642 [Neocallimastix sp. JGI-2020a]
MLNSLLLENRLIKIFSNYFLEPRGLRRRAYKGDPLMQREDRGDRVLALHARSLGMISTVVAKEYINFYIPEKTNTYFERKFLEVSIINVELDQDRYNNKDEDINMVITILLNIIEELGNFNQDISDALKSKLEFSIGYVLTLQMSSQILKFDHLLKDCSFSPTFSVRFINEYGYRIPMIIIHRNFKISQIEVKAHKGLPKPAGGMWNNKLNFVIDLKIFEKNIMMNYIIQSKKGYIREIRKKPTEKMFNNTEIIEPF